MSPRATILETFRSLRIRNYRLFFGGQIVSLSGTWMQLIAQNWLVLKLTGSGTALGVTAGLQFLPTALAGLWGGLLADRRDKRTLLVFTQSASAVLALALGVLTLTHSVTLWHVYLLAFLLGCVTVVDTPARQAFVLEMVGPSEVSNAVALNAAIFNVARIVGPALAAAAIATVGMGSAFIVNAASYLAVIAGLYLMDPAALYPAPPAPRQRRQIMEGLRYVFHDVTMRRTLLLVSVLSLLAFNFNVVLPLMAKFTFHKGAGAYALLTSLMSAGALAGALYAARREKPTMRFLAVTASLFGAFLTLAALAPSLLTESLVLVVTGAFSIAFIATANATLQLASPPELRGRVMAVYALVFLGSTPIGGPLIGWASGHFGARWGLAIGGIPSLLAGLMMGVALLFDARRRANEPLPARARPEPAH